MPTAETITLAWSPSDARQASVYQPDFNPDAPAPPAPPAEPAELVVPQRLGSVRLVRQLGRGGMGVVWLGHHEFLDRAVAVKFMLAANVDRDDPRYQTFLDGARAASQVRHLAMTAVLHADLVAGVPYLVMEYVAGPTLADVIERTGPLRLPAALAILDRVGDALDALHTAGVIHRDIKPSNILIDAAGQPFLTDFGLACRAGSKAASTTCGTLSYMAPELFERGAECSARTDVYALAATIYHALAARPLCDGTIAQTREFHRAADFPAEPLRARGIPSAVIEALQRGASCQPLHRTKSARKLVESIREAAGPTAAATASSTGPDQLARLAAAALDRAGDAPSDPDHPASSFSSTLPAPITIPSSVPCIHCGYDLRGLPATADCPECQTPIERSLAPERLIFAPAAWLSRVRRGSILTAFAMLASGLAPITVAAFAAAGLERKAAWLLAASATALTSAIFLAIAYRLAASPEPGDARRGLYRPPPASLAIALALAAIAGAIWTIIHTLTRGLDGRLIAPPVIMTIPWLVLACGLVPQLVIFAHGTLVRGPRVRWWRAGASLLVAFGALNILVSLIGVVVGIRRDNLRIEMIFTPFGLQLFVALLALPVFLALSTLWRRVERIRVDRPRVDEPSPEASPAPPGSSYYKTLRDFTERRRGSGPAAPPQPPAPLRAPPQSPQSPPPPSTD